MLKKNLIILIILASLFSNSYAETYYISNNGNNSFNGLSPIFPFKTLDKINSIIFKMKPGDVVLFERGSIFYGQINISSSGVDNNPLIFGAYGKGKNPVISGSVPLSNWEKYKENIYSSELRGNVKNLIANDNQMTLARYPNSGYLTIDNPLSDAKKGFYDKDINQSDGYWDGSIARIRTINWAYEYSAIKNFKNSSLIFSTPTFYPVQPGWGYYLDNNLNELDYPGEWFYAKGKNQNGTVYFYPPNGTDITNIYILASIYEYGIFSYKDVKNIIIQDLEISGQNEAGIYFANGITNVIIQNCTFKNILKFGITFPNNSDECIFYNNRFYNINGKAFYIANLNSSKISDNVFFNIGMIPGYGTTGDPFPMSAIQVFGNENLISGNNINNIGHDAINCLGKGNIIEKNVIKNCLLLLNDGGAIKCYGEYSKNSTWKNNFIHNVKGNFENTSGKNSTLALGIYLDDLSNNMKIINNTIVNSGFSGIGLNNGFNNLIQNNVCYDNAVGINFFQNSQSKNNIIMNNVISGKNNKQYSIDLKYLDSNLIPGKFDSNYYFNPANSNSFKVNYGNIQSEYNFEKWKSFVRSDSHSKIFTGEEVSFPMLYTNMSDDSLVIPLYFGNNYKDVNLNSIYGSLIFPPWSSQILFVSHDLSSMSVLDIAGGPLNFDKNQERSSISLLWYNLIGENLANPVIVTAPIGFEVSTEDDSGFANTISVNQVNGKVDIIIFVRFVPDEDKGYYDFISNVSGGIKTKIKVSGSSR